ncbi:MAG: aldehyde dehydrogenase family protein [Phycisphaeraceae bacterium]|nr:aldehyde dehydrogenase family protein [Phycisphaeraceae bacterium]
MRRGRILALEMGGNNAAVIMPDADLKQALVECVRSGFVTTGQRCTCTRRVIVPQIRSRRVHPAFCKAASNLIIGDPRASHPVFMGPIINGPSRDAVFAFQRSLQKAGAEILVPSTPMDTPERGFYLTPGIAASIDSPSPANPTCTPVAMPDAYRGSSAPSSHLRRRVAR